MATVLNRALSHHACPGGNTRYLHGFFPPQCSAERRILQLPKIKEVMFGQEYWWIKYSRHIPAPVTFPLPNAHCKTLPLPCGFMHKLSLTLK